MKKVLMVAAFFLGFGFSFNVYPDGDRCKANPKECQDGLEKEKKAHKEDKPADNAKKAFGGNKK
jgi:hypothetical protein